MIQQFVVPQFIDVENKIIGPLTVRQFIIFLAGAGLIVLCFKMATFLLAMAISVPIFALTGTFAFLKINGRPFHFFMLNIIQTLKKPTMKVWNKEISAKEVAGKKDKEEKKPGLVIVKRPLSASKLTQLALIVDTGGAYQEEEY